MSDDGVKKIISHIEAKAGSEASQILSEARAEAGRIISAAQKKAEREAEKIISNGEREASLEAQRILAETRISVRRRMMDAQEAGIGASLEASRRVLEELAEKGKWQTFDYQETLFSLVASASDIVPGKKLGLVFNERDRKTVTQKMLRELEEFVRDKTGRTVSLTVLDETLPGIGGVVVRDLEHAIEVDHALETKLDRLKERIRVDVARILFGDKL
jgi:vacuolar-type H+-ATPase subunit E/Vma4